ncbi:alpha/beta hydrolase [Prolixibacteraceae bacterium Z1-6]|uniref:Alpha/beta hydrolase n=1 Tax=Draconibacterium aestuarii TaxID=2998507 RepID=A0A9X3FA30_9BACT|nr:alpha/beta hydrolase [Prolixibacteraceae bacterium Z1-6]
MDAQSKFTFFLLKLVDAKKLASKTLLHPKRSKQFKFPHRLKKYLHEQFLVHRRNVVTFASNAATSSKHIVFLHGGGYTVEVQNGHWWLVEQLVKKSANKLSFIDYPLAPEHNYLHAHAMLTEAYTQLCQKHPNDIFYLLGDSAGGGFCLAFAQNLRDTHFAPQPEKIALLSPWLDLSMCNPAIAEMEPLDLLLSTKTLLSCANWFANGLDLKSPVLSPLYGTMNDLKSVAAFVGSHELFLPDCRLLKQKLESSNTPLFYKEYSGMQHDFILFPIKARHTLLNDVLAYFG